MQFEVCEVSVSELKKFKEKLYGFLPESTSVYGLIDMQQRFGPLKCIKPRYYLAKNPKFSSFIFVTPVSSEITVQTFYIFWDFDEIDDADVGKLIGNIPDFDWNLPVIFLVSSYKFKLKLDELIKKKIISNQLYLEENVEESCGEGISFSLLKEDFKAPKIPEGYEIRTLPPSSASNLLSTWDYNFMESLEGLEERLSLLNGIGAFKKSSENEGGSKKETLVAWTHQYMTGIIGMTYTIPEERKKGLAAAVTLTLAKRILDEGRIPYLMTELNNTSSVKFHQKLGFKIIGDCGISIFLPEGMTLQNIVSK